MVFDPVLASGVLCETGTAEVFGVFGTGVFTRGTLVVTLVVPVDGVGLPRLVEVDNDGDGLPVGELDVLSDGDGVTVSDGGVLVGGVVVLDGGGCGWLSDGPPVVGCVLVGPGDDGADGDGTSVGQEYPQTWPGG